MKNVKDKMWAILVHLSDNMSWEGEEIVCDDETWDYIVDEAEKAGFNTIVLDVLDAVEYASHPEISVNSIWNKHRVKKEIEKCRKKGIKIIPKLNFSSSHDKWLGEYARMISTKIYYQVCYDLIKEVYAMFECPEYIHLGMDEENNYQLSAGGSSIVIYRKDELFWHDMRFLVDCVEETGAKAWVWHDMPLAKSEEFKKYFEPGEVLISPWYYRSFHEEHFSPMPPERQAEFGNLNLKYLEEGFIFANVREKACPLAHEGFIYVPTASVWSNNEHNAFELIEHFELGAPDSQIVGYMTAPWCLTKAENKDIFKKSFDSVKEAREHFYK